MSFQKFYGAQLNTPLVLSHSQPRQVLACIRNSAGVWFLANVALTHSNLGATSNGKGECMLMLG